MIELRWALQHRGYIEKERILQFRVDPSYGLGQWTEWQDVPEVEVSNPEPSRQGER
jgi:hypothetical protein